MDSEIKKRKYYIYENIDKFNDHNQIINLIKMKNCQFTENGNGIFLNISTLDPDMINIIYQILVNTLDYSVNEYSVNHFNHDNEVTGKVVSYNVNIKSDNQLLSEELLLDFFSKEEQEIINYSKKYKLEI